MSSELRVNKLTSRSGVGTVTFNDSGLIITGIATAATLDITGNATIAGVLSYDDVTNVDSVGIITARSGLRVVGAASSIGVGIANPAEKIDVAGSIQSDTGLKVAGHPVVGYANLGGGEYAARLGSTGSSTLNKTQIYARGAHVATFDGASGHVGINRTNPFGVLDILGSGDDLVRFQSADGDLTQRLVSADGNLAKLEFTDSSAYRAKIQAETNDSLTFYTGGVSSERVRITSGGDVTIGNSSVAFPSGGGLQVYNASAPRIKLTNSTTGVASGDGFQIYLSGSSAILDQKENAEMRFYTNATEKVRITSAGNFGIGVTPNVKLHVKLDTNKHLYFQGNIGEIGNVPGIQGVTDAGSLASLGLRGNDLRFATGSSERMRIDSSGNIAIGTVSASSRLHVKGAADSYLTLQAGTTDGNDGVLFQNSGGTQKGALLYDTDDNYLLFNVNSSERMRIDSSGRLLVGRTASGNVGSGAASTVQIQNAIGFHIGCVATQDSGGAGGIAIGKSRNGGIVQSGDDLGSIVFAGHDGVDLQTRAAAIEVEVDGTPGSNDMPGRILFKTTADGSNSPTERMRIDSAGNVGLINGHIDTTSGSSARCYVNNSGFIYIARSAGPVALFNRNTNDGDVVLIRQGNSNEGSISVSGTTVSYNGAHLSRWSQLPGGAERTEILRGSVLSNIDEMCEWGEEDNEQLNRMQVSDTEGDRNVSGVFQCWDDDDDTYTNDFYCAMTGDFVIRIAQGTTVARGDLLMSAGDGTAKPQDDDIVRSKTIAKVTSTTVSATYSDGSYCVPCVLMAC